MLLWLIIVRCGSPSGWTWSRLLFQLMNGLPSTYGTVFTGQENRPKGMEYFDFVVNEVYGQRIQELQDHKAARW